MKRYFSLLLAAALLAAACNKDEEFVGPEGPNRFTVIEWTPAPGQFINEDDYAGADGRVTAASAAAWAQGRLDAGLYVSLGGFGGYIVVAAERPVVAGDSGYDFVVRSNPIPTSNEPGIVWVMADTNGNGLPDEEWYELRGSETGRESTWKEYAVTYYRPAEPYVPVRWTDNRGGEGEIARIETHHRQESYYPSWIAADSYTLRGTRLADTNRYDEASMAWVNLPYEWGYVDNIGSDRGAAGATCFRIAHATDASGAPVVLRSIDFIKVQTAVNFQSEGNIGEVSTEVCGFAEWPDLL